MTVYFKKRVDNMLVAFGMVAFIALYVSLFAILGGSFHPNGADGFDVPDL